MTLQTIFEMGISETMSPKTVMMKMMISVMTLPVLWSVTQASINIKTLPPNLERVGLSALPSVRSTISPDWTGQHSAALDADQDKVWLSWTIEQQYITFKVCPNMVNNFTLYFIWPVKSNSV